MDARRPDDHVSRLGAHQAMDRLLSTRRNRHALVLDTFRATAQQLDDLIALGARIETDIGSGLEAVDQRLDLIWTRLRRGAFALVALVGLLLTEVFVVRGFHHP